ncbi:HDOD domain-containing protein [Thiomicrorhabdus indica]|uniref:HDOD domain-containing protein n=1 Tax=Thiomicrorhabdus indica TaxID=2267253 RepID=UPI002AA8AEB3|nr:HDOD domain-containing protein [Thiomicrorhabdus indica]
MSRYDKIIQKAQTLLPELDVPIIPDELVKIQQLLNKHDMPDFQQLGDLISQNPYIAAEIVSLANLPFFNPQGTHIKDLDSAIFHLGINQIKDYVLSIHIKQKFLDRSFKGLGQHSHKIALICAAIANNVKSLNRSEAFFIGLLHDIGCFALYQMDPNYGIVFQASESRFNDNNQAEFKRYGTSHSAFGYVIAQTLNLPEDVALTVLLHHETKFERINHCKVRTNITMLRLAHLIHYQQTSDQPNLQTKMQQALNQACELLNIDETTIRKIQLQTNNLS